MAPFAFEELLYDWWALLWSWKLSCDGFFGLVELISNSLIVFRIMLFLFFSNKIRARLFV